jgi:hypothetical protein
MRINRQGMKILGCLLVSFIFTHRASADQPVKTIAHIKPAVVAIASFHKTRAPALKFVGSASWWATD